jgi:hypothetical protein
MPLSMPNVSTEVLAPLLRQDPDLQLVAQSADHVRHGCGSLWARPLRVDIVMKAMLRWMLPPL